VYAESNGDSFRLMRLLVVELEGLEGIKGNAQLDLNCSYNAASDAIAYSARRGVTPSGKREMTSWLRCEVSENSPYRT
jgi:hypothetical protein